MNGQLKYLLFVTSIAFVLAFGRACHADSYATTHDWDHFGTSFAVQTVTYGLSKKAFRMSRTDALIFSFVATTMITTMYQIVAMPQNTAIDGHTLLMNTLGSAAAVGTCIAFEF
jgi:hypothetical protein